MPTYAENSIGGGNGCAFSPRRVFNRGRLDASRAPPSCTFLRFAMGPFRGCSSEFFLEAEACLFIRLVKTGVYSAGRVFCGRVGQEAKLRVHNRTQSEEW